MFCENVAYPEIAGLYSYGNPFEDDCERQVGSCGEGVYGGGSLRTDLDEGKVFDVEVSGEGQCERFFEGVEVEERRVGAGGGEDQ